MLAAPGRCSSRAMPIRRRGCSGRSHRHSAVIPCGASAPDARRPAGLAALLVERRGTRGAAAPGCVLPFDTYGREESMEQRIARDALEALRAAAKQARLDTSRVLFAGVRSAAPTAIRAALLHG